MMNAPISGIGAEPKLEILHISAIGEADRK
jgi:hypothetical protein